MASTRVVWCSNDLFSPPVDRVFSVTAVCTDSEIHGARQRAACGRLDDSRDGTVQYGRPVRQGDMVSANSAYCHNSAGVVHANSASLALADNQGLSVGLSKVERRSVAEHGGRNAVCAEARGMRRAQRVDCVG